MRVLAQFLHLDEFQYKSSEEIKQEVKTLVDRMPALSLKREHPAVPLPHTQQLSRVGDIPIYATDSLVRHATPLAQAQKIVEGEVAFVRLHPKTAEKLNLKNGEKVTVLQKGAQVQLSLMLDARVALHSAWIFGGITETLGLGDLFGEVEIKKC